MDMDRSSGSSIRVSATTRKRVALLAVKLKACNQQDVVDRALDQLEDKVFWEGFEEEAEAYLASYPKERTERDRYAGTSSDGMKARQ
jgi:hypothetical protein